MSTITESIVAYAAPALAAPVAWHPHLIDFEKTSDPVKVEARRDATERATDWLVARFRENKFWLSRELEAAAGSAGITRSVFYQALRHIPTRVEKTKRGWIRFVGHGWETDMREQAEAKAESERFALAGA